MTKFSLSSYQINTELCLLFLDISISNQEGISCVALEKNCQNITFAAAGHITLNKQEYKKSNFLNLTILFWKKFALVKF